jgi:uncharacterized protein (TIGR03067 family)
MNGFLLWGVAVALFVGGSHESVREKSAREQLAGLEGIWIAESFVHDGKELIRAREGSKSSMAVKIKGDRLTCLPVAIGRGTAIGVKLEFILKIDPAKKLLTMDLMYSGGTELPSTPKKGEVIRAIFEVDRSELRIAGSGFGMARPNEFKSGPDSGQWVSVLKRLKK